MSTNDTLRLAVRARDWHAAAAIADADTSDRAGLRYFARVVAIDASEPEFDVAADIASVRAELRDDIRREAINTYGDLP